MERIKSTPMVFGYVATLRFFLILWLGTLPLALIGAYGWLAPAVLSFISFLFFNVEQVPEPQQLRRQPRQSGE